MSCFVKQWWKVSLTSLQGRIIVWMVGTCASSCGLRGYYQSISFQWAPVRSNIRWWCSLLIVQWWDHKRRYKVMNFAKGWHSSQPPIKSKIQIRSISYKVYIIPLSFLISLSVKRWTETQPCTHHFMKRPPKLGCELGILVKHNI